MDKRIHSKNADYQKFDVLKTNRNKRYKYGEFFVEGVRNINEAVKNNWCISSFIYTDEKELSGWAKNIINTVKTEINYILTSALMNELSDKTDTSELLAVVKMKQFDFSAVTLSENPIIVLFDRPSNKGTLIRSCDSFGADAIIITGHCVDQYDSEVIAASMGSFFGIPVIKADTNTLLESIIVSLKKKYNDFQVVATTAHKQTTIYEVNLTKPCMLMIGNETDGLSNFLYDLADMNATIPMALNSSATSFNVACAATVVLYEIIRQRGKNI